MTKKTKKVVLTTASPERLWAIVLAAGEGTRLASVTRLLHGREVPKQFAAFYGEHTLLQRTMERIGMMVAPQRTVVVVAEERFELAAMQLARYPGVQIVPQPSNAGTGPGVFLPLSLIKARCSEATVVVTPSDHHIPVSSAFVGALQRALEAAPHAPAGLALLGADADAPAVDLGWIVPRAHTTAAPPEIELVANFVEKPKIAAARRLFQSGGLWNTLVVAGDVASFWAQGRKHMPRQMAFFDRYVGALTARGARPESVAETRPLLRRLYGSMPSADFSRTVLQNADGLAVVRLRGSGWCDCGTPERLLTCFADTSDHRYRLLRDIVRSVQSENRLRLVGNEA